MSWTVTHDGDVTFMDATQALFFRTTIAELCYIVQEYQKHNGGHLSLKADLREWRGVESLPEFNPTENMLATPLIDTPYVTLAELDATPPKEEGIDRATKLATRRLTSIDGSLHWCLHPELGCIGSCRAEITCDD